MVDKVPLNEVFNEDCMAGMARYPDKFFDLAIVDPPYGINATAMNMGSNPTRIPRFNNGSGGSESTAVRLKRDRLNSGGGAMKNSTMVQKGADWDYAAPGPEYFAEIERVSKNRIIWGGNYFPLPPTRCIVAWDKKQPWDNFSQWEMAWTSLDSPAPLFRMSNTGGHNHVKKIHPTQKPVALYKWLLTKFGNGGGHILDTHMGSQSSRIAAFEMGFDYTGFEIDPDYFTAGNKRFAEMTAQAQLFSDPDLYTTPEGYE